MKMLIAIAMFLVACIGANAQIYVGGSLGFESSKASDDADNLISWSVIPEIGYALNDVIAFGFQVGYSSQELSKSKKSNSLMFAPYTRFTFAKSGLARFFIDGGITITSMEYKDDFYDKIKGNQLGFGIRPGICIAASEKINLIAKLGYLGYSSYSEDLGGGSSFGFSMDNTDISFGVFYKF